MSKTMAALLLAMIATACTSDGPAGSGDDVLPKRGELTSDPTIVSARASCYGGVVAPGGTPPPPELRIRIDGSDPTGKLGTCAITIGSITEQDDFDDGTCVVFFSSSDISCEAGTKQVVGITASNQTGGFTTASVTLTVAD